MNKIVNKLNLHCLIGISVAVLHNAGFNFPFKSVVNGLQSNLPSTKKILLFQRLLKQKNNQDTIRKR